MFLLALVCLSVCLFVTTITKQNVDGSGRNFLGRFLGGKASPSSFSVTIAQRWTWVGSIHGYGWVGLGRIFQHM